MKYHLSDIATIVGGRLVGCDLEVTAVATDSRSYALMHDTLFVAMRGVITMRTTISPRLPSEVSRLLWWSTKSSLRRVAELW